MIIISPYFGCPSLRHATYSALFSTLTPMQLDFLQSAFSFEEIKRAVWDCGSIKALGPDGFSFWFFKRHWDLVAVDVEAFVNHFFFVLLFQKGAMLLFSLLFQKLETRKLKNIIDPLVLSVSNIQLLVNS